MNEITRVLLVEDDPADHLLVIRLFDRATEPRDEVEIEHAACLRAALDRLGKGDVDVLLLDLNLPDSEGIGTVTRVRESDVDTPIVVFTGAGDEETALEALKAGAQDYLVKGEVTLSLLRRSIRYAIERCRMAAEGRRLRALLLEAEKRESLCVLGAGAAFGFNRLAGEILDELDTAHLALAEGEPERARSSLASIQRVGMQVSRLAEQLRDYAVPRPLSMEPLDLSAFVMETSGFLESIVSPAVTLDYDLPQGLPCADADSVRLRRLLTNFVANASEAIGDRCGRIEISTGIMEAAPELLAEAEGSHGLDPGPRLFLRVRDDGRYIEAKVRRRLFDPFFSTKFAGWGLGLSAAFGIARQHGGAIHVSSSREAGTAFTLLLPLRTPQEIPRRIGRLRSRLSGRVQVVRT